MKVKLYNLSKKAVGEVSLDKGVFGLKPRQDVIKRVLEWQLAKARAGTHKTKTISEVSGTTKKPFKQKGTGNARQGSLRSVHMRGGGRSHGPVPRSHAIGLQKKFRKLGMRHALSLKYVADQLIVVDSLSLDSPKTSALVENIGNFGSGSFLLVDASLSANLLVAYRNIPNLLCLPQIGANVYDIVKYDYLVITESALKALEMRLQNA